MFRPRVIPCLLLKNQGLVKTVKFKNSRYVGDPMNAIRIFNKKKADELIFLDIMATKENRIPDIELIKNIGEECMMPFSVGGGIKSMKDIESIFTAGAEKVVINTCAVSNPTILKKASLHFGRQSIIAAIDVKKKTFGGYTIYTHGGKNSTGIDPIEYVKILEEYGAGEIFLNSIDRDGTYEGYNIELIKSITNLVNIPVIACGGAGTLDDLKRVWIEGNAFAAAAGSMFVFHGRKRAVLINYPSRSELLNLYKS